MNRWRLVMVLCGILLSSAVRSEPVTFQVDMGPFLAAGYFDPATDTVEVRGDFDAWSPGLNTLQAAQDNRSYTTAVDVPVGPVAYKFVIIRSGGAAVWEDPMPDREWIVPAGGGIVQPVFFADLEVTTSPDARLVGADLSFVPQLQSLGATFSYQGQATPLLPLMADAGMSLVRLRLWHSPEEPWHDVEATVAFAHQIRDAGIALMLDLHFSDTWADPGHQEPPALWMDVSGAALVDSVSAYTARVVHRFVAEGLPLRYVQLGNEIDGGMIWDQGRVGWSGSVWDTPDQWATLTSLLQTAAEAVRATLPPDAETELVLHVSQGGDNAHCQWFFEAITAAGVDFDVIGLSYYPWWHGSLWELETNLRDLGPRFGKKMMVVETAYPWTLEAADAQGNFVTATTSLPAGYPATPLGQRDFLRDVLRVVETAGGMGVIYWEPAFIPVNGGPGNPYENLTLFDFSGESLTGLHFGAAGIIPSAVRPSSGDARLMQNFPNPFNPRTTIQFTLSEPAKVELDIYDAAGRHVRRLIDGRMISEGTQRILWNGCDDAGRHVPAGIYFYRLDAGRHSETKRMVLAK